MSLLEPGSHRTQSLVDDNAFHAAVLRVEAAWLVVVTGEDVDFAAVEVDPVEVEGAGNPVLPVVEALRAGTPRVHRGLTSQDVVDTAMMLMARTVLDHVGADLDRAAARLAALARGHRDSVMAGRTLTQYAVPVTFGLRAAQWLTAVLDARDRLAAVDLPVQCGGAAGTLALAEGLVPDAVHAAAEFARLLGLTWPGLPWHTRRTPVTRLAEACVEAATALGRLAGDVLFLGRPEVGEARELPPAGQGRSSTMPHKANPVLSVLVRSAALRAPHLAAQLQVCAVDAADERSAGPWHAEWPALRDLLHLTATAAAQTVDLLDRLVVDAEAMRARVAAAPELASESGGADPLDYTGLSGRFVDTVLERWEAHRA